MKKGALLIISLLVISTGFAKSYYYKSIDLNVSVMSNGDLFITEKETLTFDGSFSYVYRDFNSIVYNFKISGDIDSYERDGNKYTWRGSWKDTTKTFILEYIIKDPFTVTRDNDTLYYTIVFLDRTVAVKSSTAYFTFPEGIDFDETNYRVNKGSAMQVKDNTLLLQASNIPRYSAFDFEITLPKGVIEPPNTIKNFISMNPELVNILTLIPIILLVYLTFKAYSNYFKQKKEKDKSVDVYQKTRIEDLKPAIAGLLVDYSVGVKEITATMIDLAVKGYIFIHKVVKAFWPDETFLIRVKDNYTKLNDYEKKIMNTIFNKGKKVSMNKLKTKFTPLRTRSYSSTPLKKILDLIQDEAVTLELTEKRIDKLITSKILNVIKPLLLGLFLSIAYLFALIVILGDITGIVIALIIINIFAQIISLGVLSILSRNVIKLTPKGLSARKTYEDLMHFIKEQPLTEGRLFDTYLPYAIALGVQKHWVKKAQELEYTSRSNWHSSNINTMAIIALTASMNSSVTPPSSGGSGGGGFGGGGGAGGGGGGAG